jgi:hypothetical protein
MQKKESTSNPEIHIEPVKTGIVHVCIVGRSPLICNRMSEKAMRTLLLPGGKMNAAQKAVNLKHDPLKEFRDSVYTNPEQGSTRIQGLNSFFKKGMMTAAVDIPHAKKAQIGRLVYLPEDRVDIYGVPKLMMSVTRSSDQNHTPDVRTRAILPRWAGRFPIHYRIPFFNDTTIVNLLASAGVTAGAGDWRIEKGGSYGRYELVNDDDAEFLSLLEEGREAQDLALANPVAYNDETQSLLEWFAIELDRRGKDQEQRDKKKELRRAA